MNDFLTLAKERFSVRKFKDTPVPADTIESIMYAAQAAPTACNFQPQHIFVLQSKEALSKLRQCTRFHFDAPLAMLICYDRTQSWKRRYDGQDSGWVDASIVTTYLMLAAWEQGIGSTWVMSFDPEAAKAEFDLPDHLIPVAFLPMGYPAEDAQVNPLHYQNKSLEETATYL